MLGAGGVGGGSRRCAIPTPQERLVTVRLACDGSMYCPPCETRVMNSKTTDARVLVGELKLWIDDM